MTLNMEWLLVPDAQPSLVFTKNGLKNRKYPVSGSCLDKNALLMSEVRGMDPSCLVSTVQAGGGVMLWGIFFGTLCAP